MIENAIFALVVLAAVILLNVVFRKQQSGEFQSISKSQTMVCKSDSTDVFAESYHPGIRGSVGPFPMGKRTERKKTETFENRENQI